MSSLLFRSALRSRVRMWAFGLATLLAAVGGVARSQRGDLAVIVRGAKADRGTIIVKLFRQKDDVPKGPAFLQLTAPARKAGSRVSFRDVALGKYAIFVFHDENENGTLDHNFVGIPKEPMGFSGGFRLSLWSGVPNFDDLDFDFTADSAMQRIDLR
jgi:uncharacterized protein (DUF2141 family)